MIEEGFLSYNELTFIDAEELMTFTGLTEEQALEVLDYAEQYADHMDRAAEEERRVAEEAAAAAAAEAAAAEAAAGDVVADTDPATAGPDAASFAGEPADVEPEAVSEEAEPRVSVIGDSSADVPAPPAKPVPAYREGMPTDLQGVEEALIHEEERSGEDGEITTQPEEETGGASA
jgi:N utilization substance protein A